MKLKNSIRDFYNSLDKIKKILWVYGLGAVIVKIFIINNISRIIHIIYIDFSIILLSIVYFLWCIARLIKYRPKKPKISKEEKKRIKDEHNKLSKREKKELKKQKRRAKNKILFEKLTMKRPFSKFNPFNVLIAASLYFIVDDLIFLLVLINNLNL